MLNTTVGVAHYYSRRSNILFETAASDLNKTFIIIFFVCARVNRNKSNVKYPRRKGSVLRCAPKKTTTVTLQIASESFVVLPANA